MRFLANENFLRSAVEALRGLGHDVAWSRTDSPGASDEDVLVRSAAEQRVLLTFDNDFGKLAFKAGLPVTCGIVLFRIRKQSNESVTKRIVEVISSRGDWQGHYAVVDAARIRVRVSPSPGG